jgi:DNA (cytosine-5)-methyltransferase 1
MKINTKVKYEYNSPIDETHVELLSFFSGVGFLNLGFENAGFDIAFVNEREKRFLRSYKYGRNDQHVPQ